VASFAACFAASIAASCTPPLASAAAAMRERIPMGGAAQMMRAHDAKMQQGYGGAMMMHQGMGVHRGMPYIAAQPPCSPFGAMDAGGTENVPTPPSQLALQSGRMPHQTQHSPCLGSALRATPAPASHCHRKRPLSAVNRPAPQVAWTQVAWLDGPASSHISGFNGTLHHDALGVGTPYHDALGVGTSHHDARGVAAFAGAAVNGGVYAAQTGIGSMTGCKHTRSSNGRNGTKNLSKEAVDVLKEWFQQHISWPYPNVVQQKELAEMTGLPMKKVNTWFLNARRGRRSEPPASSDVLLV